jgi:ubiquinone/menaquinone biosynthesis C-methylase UbiE
LRLLATHFLLVLALVACQSPPDLPAPHENRDRHGPPDVARYIARLESDERIKDLAPETVLSKLALAPDAVVADIGCGPGVFSLRFARVASRGIVYAVDVEPKQLDALRDQLLAGRFENIVPVLASYSTPHLPSNSCDLIFIADTYHHIDDRVEYMRRLQRVLRRGGRLAVLEYKPGVLPVGPPPEKKLAAGVMRQELTDAGWTMSERFDTHPHHTFEVCVPTQR